ncbi:hypothetical protein LTS08_001166 [Lithohypha guttulata]|nr:hypothetical protein LTS08_001166 [Lithohypha guttulata]
MGFLSSLGPKQPYFGLKGRWLTFWITVACATDMTLFGYDQGVFSGIIVTQDFLDVHNLGGPSKTSLLGCFFGAFSACYIGEKYGRKKMIVGRIIGGIGNGLNTATAPVWQTETSQVKWRAKLVVIELITNIAGFSLSNWIDYGFSYAGGAIAWRFPLAFQLVFIRILFVTVPWLPESPRWLIAHEFGDEAFSILADPESKDSNDPYILQQHKEIVFTVQYERDNVPRWLDLLRGKTGDRWGTCTIRRLVPERERNSCNSSLA